MLRLCGRWRRLFSIAPGRVAVAFSHGKMIAAHNSRQCLRAALALVLSLACYAAGYFFFDAVFRFVLGYFAKPWLAHVPALVAGVLVLITLAGFFRWRSGKAYYGYAESGLFLDMDSDTAGAFVVERAAHRVTGPAWLLGQIFLAAPLQFFKAVGCLRSCIPADPQLEARLADLLAGIEANRKWEDVHVYNERLAELEMLVRMGLVDYSRTRGRVHARA